MSGLAGPRRQNLISISDVLDLKSAQKPFCSLFSCHFNYGLEIEFVEGEMLNYFIFDNGFDLYGSDCLCMSFVHHCKRHPLDL